MTAPARKTARMRSCRWQTKYYWTKQSRCVALHPCVARREKNLQRPNSACVDVAAAVGAADAGARLKGRAMLIGALVLLLVAACSCVAQNDGGRQIVPGVEASDAVGGDLGTELVRMHASHTAQRRSLGGLARRAPSRCSATHAPSERKPLL